MKRPDPIGARACRLVVTAAPVGLMLACILTMGAAHAQISTPDRSASLPAEERRASRLDQLFRDLKAAPNAQAARPLMQRIERAWAVSGSDTADLLMQRVVSALEKRQADLAVELADRILALKPDWAEAWHQRAAAFVALGDNARAVLDLAEAVKREPRHYAALVRLGSIFQRNEDKKNALAAFRQALAINPHLEGIARSITRLAPEVDGIDL